MTERELHNKLKERLSTYFKVYSEVWTSCKTGRIDLVLKCNRTNNLMGLEIKKINKKRGNDMGLLIKQAHEYSQKYFIIGNITAKIPIFIFPSLSYDYLICPEEKQIIEGVEYFRDRHTKNSIHHTMQGILGVWNVGELRVYKHNADAKYIRFVFNNKEIWTNHPQWNSAEIKGFHIENYKHLIQRINDSNSI